MFAFQIAALKSFVDAFGVLLSLITELKELFARVQIVLELERRQRRVRERTLDNGSSYDLFVIGAWRLGTIGGLPYVTSIGECEQKEEKNN